MSETRKLAAILVADVVGYSRLAGYVSPNASASPPVFRWEGPLTCAFLPYSAPAGNVSSGSMLPVHSGSDEWPVFADFVEKVACRDDSLLIQFFAANRGFTP
jgi:hypothetical protein